MAIMGLECRRYDVGCSPAGIFAFGLSPFFGALMMGSFNSFFYKDHYSLPV